MTLSKRSRQWRQRKYVEATRRRLSREQPREWEPTIWKIQILDERMGAAHRTMAQEFGELTRSQQRDTIDDSKES